MNPELSFGDWLRQRRRALDLTQAELARQVGCSAIALRKLEAEERRPSKQIAERLAQVLNVPPDDREAFLRFARGDPFAAGSSISAPIPTEQPPAPRHNLPLQLTSFIGREKEITEVTRLISTERLVTLTGAGGSGKTRLALQVASELAASFPGGVALIELASLTDPALVPQSVATGLGVRGVPGRPLVDVLLDDLRPKRLLLVLDNCEHLILACAELAVRLLQACPNLTLLVTSREPLSVTGEHMFWVPSLSAPGDHDPVSADTLSGFEAVQLFLDRAQAARPEFVLTASNASAVAEVCRRLDGIPLALELAAARLRLLPVEQLAARLDDAFQLLTGGSRTALPRHQTLQALLDWSYDLLAPAEQTLLRRLSVFAGGWTLEAAEAVCAGDGLDQPALPELLGRLVDKSLVLAAEQAGVARYRLLETVRQYALPRLAASGEADQVRQRHAEFYLALAEAGAPGPFVPLEPAWLDQMELERDNLLAALSWSLLAPSRVELALRLTEVLTDMWYPRGYFNEARDWLESVLARPEAADYPSARARAMLEWGYALALQGDFQAGEPFMAHALRIFQDLGDRRRVAYALGRLGWAAREQGNAEAACARLQEAVALWRELGYQRGICAWTLTLGEAMTLRGDLVAAKALLEENLVLARQLADISAIGWTFNHLGHIAQLQGEYEQATHLHEASLPFFHQLGARNLGHVWAHESLGEIALAQGDTRGAALHFADSLGAAQDVGDREALAHCLAGLAGVAVLDEEPERAAQLWSAAEALRQLLGTREAPASRATRERLMAAAREQLGEEAFDAASAEGEKLTMEQAVALALEARVDTPD